MSLSDGTICTCNACLFNTYWSVCDTHVLFGHLSGDAMSMSRRPMYIPCMYDGRSMSLYAHSMSVPPLFGDAMSMSDQVILVYIPYVFDDQSASLYVQTSVVQLYCDMFIQLSAMLSSLFDRFPDWCNKLDQYLTPPLSHPFHHQSFLLLYFAISSPSPHPCSHCRRLQLLLQRNCMRCHDFNISCLVLMDSLSWCGCCHLIQGEITSTSLVELYSKGFRLPSELSLGLCVVVSRLCFLAYKPGEHTKVITPSLCSMDNIEDIGGLDYMSRQKLRGGGRAKLTYWPDIQSFTHLSSEIYDNASVFTFVGYMDEISASAFSVDDGYVLVDMPLPDLISQVPVSAALKIARAHNISVGSHVPKKYLLPYFLDHTCIDCKRSLSVFKSAGTRGVKVAKPQVIDDLPFPPLPITPELNQRIISDFCNDSSPKVVEESGCAVCGQLTSVSNLSRLKGVKGMLSVLEASGVTRIERKSSKEHAREFRGPVLDHQCNMICNTCRVAVRKGKIPHNALANGLWIGNVPKELSELRFIEKLLIAQLRHNCCFVRVASGMRKMTSHIVAFKAPIPKLYNVLPPPIEDLDEVLAILFTGPSKPTPEDFTRTPLLVRRNAVANALEWLKLNHSDYSDIEISYDNLAQYSEHDPPVSVEYRKSLENKYPENTSVFDDENEDGTVEGDCPFVVHGLTGENLDTMTNARLKGIALSYLNNGGKLLAVGHSEKPESIYNNPQYYPQMFPWLFPYGLGGIGSTHLSETAHRRFLLMYHDKRFQTDVYFPFVAFSHSQVKSSTTGAFLLAEKKKFHHIADRILSVDQTVLTKLAKRMASGEKVIPQSQAEKDCFQVIRDLDNVSSRVDGSLTSKKYMRSEIWSLMAYYGAPSWYITLSPADVKHPLCLYFADSQEKFSLDLRPYDERIRMIARNPVAGARFFHFMVELFIKHILGVGTDHPGVYGNTSAYYGTVEQQGRLTLHLHLLLWIKGCLSPQEIRDRLLDPDSDFKTCLIDYLESAHIGEFLTGSQSEILDQVTQMSQVDGYTDPTQTLPKPPPTTACQRKCGVCHKCKSLAQWCTEYEKEVDDLILKSNVHRCSENAKPDKVGDRVRPLRYVGCVDSKTGKCKARFPRQIFEKTEVDPESGAVNMKKLEPMINTVTPSLTYLFRCNTDVTSLKSGTAIKAVIMYVTDYITKCSLKTRVLFDIIRSTYQKNSEMIGGTVARHEKARKSDYKNCK